MGKKLNLSSVETEKIWTQLFRDSPDGIALADAETGIILDCNAALAKLVGWKKNEIIGQLQTILHPPDETENGFSKSFIKHRADKKWQTMDVRLITKAGKIKTAQVSAKMIELDGRKIVQGIFHDITHRIQLENELEENREKYRGLSDAAFEAIFISEKGICLEQNEAARKMFGYSDQEAIGMPGTAWIIPEGREMVLQNMLSGYEGPYETTALRKDGSTFPTIIQAKMMHYQGRNVRVTSLQDISKQKHTEIVLARNAAQLVTLYQASQEVVATLDLEQVYAAAHRAVTNLMHSDAFFICLLDDTAQEVWDVYLFDDGKHWPNQRTPLSEDGMIAQVLQTSEPVFIEDDSDGTSEKIGTVQFGSKKNTLSIIIVPLILKGKVIGAISTQHYEPGAYNSQHLQLLTTLANQVAIAIENARLVRSLDDANQKLESIFENTHISVAYLDAQFNFLRVNKAYAREDHQTPKFFLGKNHFDLYPNTENEAIFRETVQTGQPYFAYAKPFKYENNKERGVSYWDWSLVPIKDASGTVTEIILTMLEVTERKRVEDDLRLHSAVMTNMAEGVNLGKISDGNIFYTNPKFDEMLGYDQGELLGRNIAVINAPTDKKPKEIADEIKHSLAKTGVWSGEILNLKKDGTHLWCYTNVSTLNYSDYGKIWVSIHTDITERKQAEETIRRHAEEMTALQATVLGITSSVSLPKLLHSIIERAANLLGATSGGLYLTEPEQRQVRCVVSYNTLKDFTGTVLAYGQGAAGYVAQTEKPLIVDDYRTWSGRAKTFEDNQPFQAIISAPMIWQGGVIGVIHVLREEQKKFSQDALGLLTRFADHAAVAVGNARLYSGLEQELSERKQAERALQEQTDLLATVFESSPNILMLVDSDVRIKKINQAGAALTGNEQKEIVGLLGGEVVRCINSFDGKGCGQHSVCSNCPIRSRVNRALQKGESAFNEEGGLTVRKDGQEFPLDFLISTVPVKVGDETNVLVTIIDNTERKQTENALRKSEDAYRRLISHLPIGVFVHSGGNIVLANHVSAHILGAEDSEGIIGMSIYKIIPNEFREIVRDRIEKALSNGNSAPLMEQKLLRLDGGIIDIEVTSLPLIYNGQPSMLSVFNDITDRKNAENRLKFLLEEKDILLAEVHHRVKNNMQVITSLLNLQTEGIDDERILDVIEESRNRINAMALVHEQLYRSQLYSRIDLGTYIDQLASTLFNMYQVATDRVEFRLDTQEINLELERAIPCGLLINELITNSLKYAFPDNRMGKVQIKLYTEKGRVFLDFRDDGVGLPANLNFPNTHSLGLQLIHLLTTHDLHGTIKLMGENGTRYLIEFPMLSSSGAIA